MSSKRGKGEESDATGQREERDKRARGRKWRMKGEGERVWGRDRETKDGGSKGSRGEREERGERGGKRENTEMIERGGPRE